MASAFSAMVWNANAAASRRDCLPVWQRAIRMQREAEINAATVAVLVVELDATIYEETAKQMDMWIQPSRVRAARAAIAKAEGRES